jgi:hypothetical protein
MNKLWCVVSRNGKKGPGKVLESFASEAEANEIKTFMITVGGMPQDQIQVFEREVFAVSTVDAFKAEFMKEREKQNKLAEIKKKLTPDELEAIGVK